MATKRKSKEDDEQEEMVMVGPGADEEVEEEEPEEREEKPAKKKVAAKKVAAKEEDEEEAPDEETPDEETPDEDERVGHADEEEDARGKRESRKARRERQKRARQRNEVELNFLRQRNAALEKRVNEISKRQDTNEVSTLDQRIAGLQSQLKVADQVLAKAIESGNGEDVVEATNIRDKIRDNMGRLAIYKQEMARRTETPDTESVDPNLVFYAQQFIAGHSWYDPNGSDKDSRAVTAIDNRLVQEGYDPRTKEYWDELESRVQGRLPHRFANGSDEEDEDEEEETPPPRRETPARRGNGPRFSVGGRERPLRKNEVYVSPERKAALIEAGAWDDPVLRQKYLKRYAQWDRENRDRDR